MSPTSRLFLPLATLALVLTQTGCIPLVAAGGAAAGGAHVAGEERTLGRQIDDTSLATKVRYYFSKSKWARSLATVDIEVHEGRVLLTGATRDPHVGVEAARLAWVPEGVKEVINEIRVTDETGGPLTYANDAWITTRIDAKLLTTSGIRSTNYSVETIHGIVYLLGIAQSRQELDRVLNIIRVIPGVKKVVSHVRLKGDPRRSMAPQQAGH